MSKIFLLLILPLILSAREWTALVYMAADNDLAQWADSDLVEMEKIGSSEDITILVQVDKPNIGAKRLLISKGTSYELQNLGIIDMCDWQTLYNFLDWGIHNYPADRYFVILWDHGTGWTLIPRRSFGNDWSSGNQMSISNGDFRKAISTTYNYTGEKINLFAFDACLMQQIEIAYEIKDYAKVFLAPQTVCPIQGFRYDRIFEALSEDPNIDESELAKSVVEINVDNYTNVQPVVYGAINLGNLNKLKESSDKLINSLMINSPNQSIINLREDVQTIPVIGDIPAPDDEFMDLGDFVKGLYEVLSGSETEQLWNVYNKTIVKTAYWGENFSKTTGLTVWFPLQYLQFKQLLNNYTNLTWTQSKWLQFLNWFYDKDDIRPTSIHNIRASNVGENNDFRLYWSESYDLAPVTYSLIEARDGELIMIFTDLCEDSSSWNFNGFTLNSNNFHSGSHSFFSGNASGLQNWVETKEPLLIENLGILSIYLYYNTEEMTDSLIIEYGQFKDVHYGRSNGWHERRVILPPGNYRLKISYHTNGSINNGGCYIDDIDVFDVKEGRYIRQDYSDTSIYIFNKLRGEYHYAVFPKDRYGNIGNLTDFMEFSIENYASPYSNPNPFQTSCKIVLDYPDSLHPTVEIFSISGIRIRKFGADEIENKIIHWNGKDKNNRDIDSGLYFILVKDGSFKKIGKIARQR